MRESGVVVVWRRQLTVVEQLGTVSIEVARVGLLEVLNVKAPHQGGGVVADDMVVVSPRHGEVADRGGGVVAWL